MKKSFYLFLFLLYTLSVFAQKEEQKYIGDDFNLEGALALFKKSTSLDEFESLLNQEANNVNNLDLNDDGEVDFIGVSSVRENDNHAIVLTAYIKENELQDVAVIGIEKVGTESARLQIEGDPEIFSENTIVEPKADGASSIQTMIQELVFESSNEDAGTLGQYAGVIDDVSEEQTSSNNHLRNSEISQTPQVFVNVWFWPGVRVLYAPGYVVRRSPWHWGVYPLWWKPWRPVAHRVFYKRGAGYRVFYHRVPGRSVVVAHRIYAPGRRHSTVIVHKHRRGAVIIKNKPGRGRAVRVKRGRRF